MGTSKLNLSNYRKISNETDTSLPLSFGGFSRYAAHLFDKGEEFENIHFKGSTKLCPVCVFNFTFIG